MPKSPGIFTIIALNCIVFFILQFVVINGDYYKILFGLNRNFFDGAFWQIISTMFIHKDFEHLLTNMLVLYAFGWRIEQYLQTKKFILLYIVGGIFTNILCLIFLLFFTNINMIGASGAISVVLGFMAYCAPQLRQGMFMAVIIMSFAPLILSQNVAWWAHIFGFGVGFVMAFARKRFYGRF